MGLPTNGWKNKNGTSDRPNCDCGTWKQHWINGTGKTWPILCSVEGCMETASDGAHLINENSDIKGEWIAPTCKGCNHRTDTFSLKLGTTLYPANVSKTCGKK